MTCSRCGQEVPEGTVFCPNCGNQVVSENTNNVNEGAVNVTPTPAVAPATAPEKKKNMIPIIIIAVVVILVIVALILVVPKFFGSKTVVCTLTDKQTTGTVDTTVTANFKGNKFDNAKFEMDYKFSGIYANYVDTIYTQLEQSFKSYNDKEGVEIKLDKKTDGVNVTMNVDQKGIENVSQISLKNTNQSADKFIKDMEDQKYTCKTK